MHKMWCLQVWESNSAWQHGADQKIEECKVETMAQGELHSSCRQKMNKKMDMVTTYGSSSHLLATYMKQLKNMSHHQFMKIWQLQNFNSAKENLQLGQLLCVYNFSQNLLLFLPGWGRIEALGSWADFYSSVIVTDEMHHLWWYYPWRVNPHHSRQNSWS